MKTLLFAIALLSISACSLEYDNNAVSDCNAANPDADSSCVGTVVVCSNNNRLQTDGPYERCSYVSANTNGDTVWCCVGTN